MRLESSVSNTSRLCTSFTVSPLCLRRNQCSWRLLGGFPLSSRMHETHFWPEHFHQFSPLSRSQPEESSSTHSTGGQSLMPSVSLAEIMKTKGRLCSRSPTFFFSRLFTTIHEEQYYGNTNQRVWKYGGGLETTVFTLGCDHYTLFPPNGPVFSFLFTFTMRAIYSNLESKITPSVDHFEYHAWWTSV